jgi:5-methylcytosine-specific restriction protein A
MSTVPSHAAGGKGLHRLRERNRDLVRSVKEKTMDEQGRLLCAACTFDLAKVYGEIGQGFIECHHLVALADLLAEKVTRPSDVALLCANCHRMIHRKRPWLSLNRLTKLLAGPQCQEPGATSLAFLR